MKYRLIKIMDMGRGENHYRTMGNYKTIKGAQKKLDACKITFPQSNITFRIIEE